MTSETEETIYTAMLEQFQQETGYEMSEEADLAVRLRAGARQLMSLYYYGDYVYRQSFPQTAEGENLDLHGALRGVERKSAQHAQGTLQFGISEALAVDLTIPAGTICLCEDWTQFETLEEATLTAGTVQVSAAAQAVEAGAAGNVLAGRVVRMQTPPDGIETVTNPSAFTGGRDEEDDESYRQRILDAYQGLSNGANAAYYKQLALSVEGIDRAQIIPRIDGVGTVGVLVSSDSGAVTDSALAEVEALMDERREVGITVTVMSPEAVSVTVKGTVTPAEGCTLDAAITAAETAIAAVFTGDRAGKTLYCAAITGAAMGTGLLQNFVLTEPTADVTVTAQQQAVLADIELGG